MKKYITITLSTLTLLTCLTGCGDKKESKEDNKIQIPREASTAAPISPSAAELSTPVETVDEPEYGIIKHTDRDYEGYYLEDYITVNFKGYEHDSDAEIIVNWEQLADDLGNGITPEILECGFSFRFRDVKAHTDDVDDLVNGDRINLITEQKDLQDAFKQKYTNELKYIDENLWYYEKTPVIVSGLKTKEFIIDTGDVDKAAVITLCDKTMEEIKDSTKDSTYMLENNYGSNIIDYVLEGKEDEILFLGNANYYTITNYKIESTYLATRTPSSYNDSSASQLPENMVFCTYKLSIERKDNDEAFDMYYRIEIGNVLFEDGKMVISDDDVKVQLARTTDDAMPDSKYWDIVEVK